MNNLWNELNDADKKMFNFDMVNINWKTLIKNSVMGGKIYLLKEPIDTVPQAIKRMRYLQIVHYVFLGLFYFALYKLITYFFGLFL